MKLYSFEFSNIFLKITCVNLSFMHFDYFSVSAFRKVKALATRFSTHPLLFKWRWTYSLARLSGRYIEEKKYTNHDTEPQKTRRWIWLRFCPPGKTAHLVCCGAKDLDAWIPSNICTDFQFYHHQTSYNHYIDSSLEDD